MDEIAAPSQNYHYRLDLYFQCKPKPIEPGSTRELIWWRKYIIFQYEAHQGQELINMACGNGRKTSKCQLPWLRMAPLLCILGNTPNKP